MELGFALPVSGSWATPENVVEIAEAADRAGYRTLWTFQRVLFPTTFEIAPVYQSVLDPLITLGYAAAVTQRARIGMAVVNGPFYAPAVLAKQLATLDVLSRGRLDAGIGLGWSPDEYAAAGVSTEHRGRRFEEWLACLDAVLTQDPVEFAGEFYTVPPSQSRPRPVQQPRPPIVLGGTAPAALRRAGRFADGWVSSSRASLADVRAGVATVRDAAQAAGKAPDSVRCVVRGVTAAVDSPVDDADRRPLHGSFEQIAADLQAYAGAGVDEVFLDLNFDNERVGNVDADPKAAMDLARAALAEFAPGG
jgi:probable F420-dependent oxidoreductase